MKAQKPIENTQHGKAHLISMIHPHKQSHYDEHHAVIILL